MRERLEQAHLYRVNGDYERAGVCYAEVLAGCPTSAEACWGMGHTLMNQGDFDGCSEYFRRSVDVEPENTTFLHHLAMFLTMIGEYDEARFLFARVVEIGDNPELLGEARKQLSYL